MKHTTHHIVLSCVFACSLFSNQTLAQSTATSTEHTNTESATSTATTSEQNSDTTLPTGDDIAQKVNERNEGVALSRNLQMEMTDKRGKMRVRETRAFRKYYGDEKRTAIFYITPKNVKDTAFLTYDYPQVEKDDDQWLYLPAMRKVRRISASDRGDYFLGTDFTFEEIKLETRVSLTDYERKTLKEDSVDGRACYVVEAKAKTNKIAKELGHSRREDCIDKERWIPLKSVLWDNKGKQLKTIHFKDIKKVQEIWTAHQISVENHKTQHKTLFTFSDVQYDENVDDAIFTQNALRRGY